MRHKSHLSQKNFKMNKGKLFKNPILNISFYPYPLSPSIQPIYLCGACYNIQRSPYCPTYVTLQLIALKQDKAEKNSKNTALPTDPFQKFDPHSKLKDTSLTSASCLAACSVACAASSCFSRRSRVAWSRSRP